MGCSSSKPAEPVAAQDQAQDCGAAFPLHAIRMKDFLLLQTLEPHNTLVEKGLVVPVDFAGEHAGEQLNFVSHQWLAYAEADPKGAHLTTMQDVFNRAIRGESIFRSEEDWLAYSKGLTAQNMMSATTKHGSAVAQSMVRSEQEFFRSIAEGWVWMDYLSIPQTITCKTAEETARVLANQKDAIQSIPDYVRHARNFWVCAPSGALHADTGLVCDYESWALRGWCRMEESTLNLVRLGEGRPLLVTQPLGKAPQVKSIDRIDRMWMYTQRSTSVLTGTFSCCRLEHKITSKDGQVTHIACDKVELKRVLTELLDAQLASLRSRLDEEGGRDLLYDQRAAHSNKTLSVFRMLWGFLMFRQLILADVVDEPDYADLGWSKKFEELTREDYLTFCGAGEANGVGGFDLDPDKDVNMIGWTAACMGHLPMLRYCVETMGASPSHVNDKGVSILMATCRFGYSKALRWLCERNVQLGDRSPIDYRSASLGLSPMCDAAKNGHPNCIQTLLDFGANVDPPRKNGKTPLHEAAEKGHCECVRLLLAAGADKSKVDNDGKTPEDLAAEHNPVREAVLAVLREAA